MEFDMSKIVITFNSSQINPEEIHDYLKTSYWAYDRTLEQVKTSINSSALVLGILYEGKVIGFARIISDQVRFGFLCDVYVLEPFRKYGLGKLIIREIMNHPIVKGLYRVSLNTKDANGLYEKYGFMYDGKKLLPNGAQTYSMSYLKVSDDYFIKYFLKEDMDDVSELIEKYWDPSLTRLIHPMFYRDFHKTCYTAKTYDGQTIGIVLSLLSQDNPDEGYIHAAFVRPDWRRKKVAQTLYNKLYTEFINRGVKKIRLITSVDNRLSQDFHKAVGFEYADECDKIINGIPAASNYKGKGQDRVVMVKKIGM